LRVEVIHGDRLGCDKAAEASTLIGRLPQVASNNRPSFIA